MAVRVIDRNSYSVDAMTFPHEGKEMIQLEARDQITGDFVPMTMRERDVRRLVGVLGNWLEGKGLVHE